jgi:hypothetical protein
LAKPLAALACLKITYKYTTKICNKKTDKGYKKDKNSLPGVYLKIANRGV